MADERLWEVDVEKTEDHWLELNSPDGQYSAVAKWDGCIDFNRYYNGHRPGDPKYNEDIDRKYIHICDLDDFIARLQALRREAIDHFTRTQGEWPG